MYFTFYEMKSLSSSSVISFCKVRTNICATENSYLPLCLNIATLQRVEGVEANLRDLNNTQMWLLSFTLQPVYPWGYNPLLFILWTERWTYAKACLSVSDVVKIQSPIDNRTSFAQPIAPHFVPLNARNVARL